MKIRIATRGSKLALIQTELIKNRLLSAFPNLIIEEIIVKTKGDRITSMPLFRVGGQGIFIKEIEECLASNQADLAVHSLKDMPHKLMEGLILGAVTPREDPRDVLVTLNGQTLYELPTEAKIGTSSLRRRALLRKLRNDIRFEDCRGNLDTRIKKLKEEKYDALVLAAAGLNRLNQNHLISEFFPVESFVPAAGQGFIGIEIRGSDKQKFEKILLCLDDPKARICAETERAFLEKIQGGCQIPIGANAKISNNRIFLTAFLAISELGPYYIETFEGSVENPKELGFKAAEKLLTWKSNQTNLHRS